MVFDWLGGLFSGIGQVTSTAMSNYQSQQNQEDAQAFNAGEAATNRTFNAQQGEEARGFASAEALKARIFADQQGEFMRTYNANEALKNRNFQAEMSNSAYQRAMQDMKAAGLNPILAYQQGGAGTPGGGAASAGAVSGPSASGPAASGSAASAAAAPVIPYGNFISSALEGARTGAEIRRIQESVHTQAATTGVVENQKAITAHEIDKRRLESQILKENLDVAKSESLKARLDTEARDTPIGGFLRRWGVGMNDVGGVGTMLNSAGTLAHSTSRLNRMYPE